MHFRDTHTQTTQTQHSKAATHKYAALQYPPPHPAARSQQFGIKKFGLTTLLPMGIK